jgi:hypothetical protein
VERSLAYTRRPAAVATRSPRLRHAAGTRWGWAAIPLVVLALSGRAHGQGGWLPTSWFSSTQPAAAKDPRAMFPLSETDGPWLVLATTFRGDTARDDARGLVHELRTKHRFDAYTHEKSFDYTGTQRGMGLNPDGTPKTMRYANAAEVVEVAVLVGDFASAEDSRGQKALRKIKSLRPESLGGTAKSSLISDFLAANRQHAGAAAEKPPLAGAMLIPNPLLPDSYFSQQVDDFVLTMNADVTYSLLDCPARYSVQVATFSGAGTFDPTAEEQAAASRGGLVDINRFVDALRGSGWQNPQLRGLESESRLVEAADNAHRLTKALRRQGWQAWEFHDRDCSIVCVGSIDRLAVPQGDAQVVHPEIARIVAGLGPDPEALARGQLLPRSFDGIMLDLQPKPIDVPRAPSRRR